MVTPPPIMMSGTKNQDRSVRGWSRPEPDEGAFGAKTVAGGLGGTGVSPATTPGTLVVGVAVGFGTTGVSPATTPGGGGVGDVPDGVEQPVTVTVSVLGVWVPMAALFT